MVAAFVLPLEPAVWGSYPCLSKLRPTEVILAPPTVHKGEFMTVRIFPFLLTRPHLVACWVAVQPAAAIFFLCSPSRRLKAHSGDAGTHRKE